MVTADWVKSPNHAAMFAGSAEEVTPYLFFTNDEDGSLLVMHSSAQDDAFGFMRWTLGTGNFHSVAGCGTRLFALADRDGAFWLVEFDTADSNRASMDFCDKLTNDPAITAWNEPNQTGKTVQLESLGSVYSDVTVDGSGNFTTPEAVTSLIIGDEMPWSFTMHPAVAATGQGPKAGKTQRLVSSEIHWENTVTGVVEGQNVLSSLDNPALSAPTPVDEWREYYIGKWGREPDMQVSGTDPGHVGVRAVVMNVYV